MSKSNNRESYKLPFGKHKGKILKDMKSTDQVGYLKWLHNSLELEEEQHKELKTRIDNHLNSLKKHHRETFSKSIDTQKEICQNIYKSFI